MFSFCLFVPPDALYLHFKFESFLPFRGNTKLERGNFILSDNIDEHEAVLEKFAFSNALCLSGENLHFNFKSLTFYSGYPLIFFLNPFPSFSSEAGNMGGLIRQLCRVNSINSRGTVNTYQEAPRNDE